MVVVHEKNNQVWSTFFFDWEQWKSLDTYKYKQQNVYDFSKSAYCSISLELLIYKTSYLNVLLYHTPQNKTAPNMDSWSL